MGVRGEDKFPWTAENRAHLIRLFEKEGKSQSECARELSRINGNRPLSTNAVAGQIRVLRDRGDMSWERPNGLQSRRKENNQTLSKKSRKNAELNAVREPPPPPAVAVVEDVSAPLLRDGQARTVETVRPFECRYPYGDPLAQYAFCGRHAPSMDRPYCIAHLRLCYPPRAKKEPASSNAKNFANFKW